MKYLEMIRLILSLLPMLIHVVKAIEEALPDGGQGEAKLALIRGAMESAYGVANDAVTKFSDIWPALESTVGAIVSMFNTVGAFKKN